MDLIPLKFPSRPVMENFRWHEGAPAVQRRRMVLSWEEREMSWLGPPLAGSLSASPFHFLKKPVLTDPLRAFLQGPGPLKVLVLDFSAANEGTLSSCMALFHQLLIDFDLHGTIILMLERVFELRELKSAVKALLKSLMKEGHFRAFRCVSFRGTCPPREELKRVLSQEVGELTCDEVLYDRGVRKVLLFKESPFPSAPGPKVGEERDETWVVLGGPKEIWRTLLQRLPEARCARVRLHFIGKDVKVGDTFQRKFKSINFRQADCCQLQELGRALHDVLLSDGSIDILVNPSSVEGGRPFKEMGLAELLAEINGHTRVFLNLMQALGQLNTSVRKLLNFSTVFSQFGHEKLATFSAAQAIINDLLPAGASSIGLPQMEENEALPLFLDEIFKALLAQEGDKGEMIFYLSAVERAQYGLGLHRPDHLRAFLGEGPNRGKLEFIKEMDLGCWAHHTTAQALGFMCLHSSLLFPTPPRLDDFVIEGPFLEHDQVKTMRSTLRWEDGGRLKILLQGHGTFSSALLSAHEEGQGDGEFLPPFTPCWEVKGLYGGRALHYGPRLQLALRAFLGPQGQVMLEMDHDFMPMVEGGETINRVSSWAEGAFQALTLAWLLQENVLAIPVAVSRVCLHGHGAYLTRPGSKVFVLTSTLEMGPKGGPDESWGSVQITGEKGELLLSLYQVRMKMIERRSFHGCELLPLTTFPLA